VLRRSRHAEEGFTLIELMIVVVVTPIIVGALAAGLIAMLSLQQGVTNRLSNSSDSQVVQASFRNDIQSAQYLTTASSSDPQCGSGYQVLGLEWNFNPGNNLYETVVSYVSVPVVNGTTTTYELVRQVCTNVTQAYTGPITPVTSSTIISTNLASNLTAAETPPTVLPSTVVTNGGYVSTAGITSVTFPITEPQGSTTYTYTLVASPPTSASSIDTGGPITSTTDAGCGYAAAGSGTYASSLCLVDLSALSGNNMVAARQGCVELSVPLPGGSTMYFCIGITGAPVAPYQLPTWTDGFLGNSINGVPFYSDVPGDPALYQNCEGGSSTCVVNGVSVPNTWGGVTTVTISDITVVAPDGNPATGWEFVSADAESTDSGESITWTSDKDLYIIPNNQSVDTPSDPIGNACNTGAGVSGTLGASTVTEAQIFAGDPATTIVCSGYSNGTKTGTMMVEALQPTSMTITMVGTGLEGISLGLLF
jgi:prepilin-type N-terminal cleavage/methylation domain-containing protein